MFCKIVIVEGLDKLENVVNQEVIDLIESGLRIVGIQFVPPIVQTKVTGETSIIASAMITFVPQVVIG